MADPRDYDPHRFRSTVPYYARYRIGYPDRLIRRVISLIGLQQGGRVLDLGCGPGLLAIRFAKAGMRVTAMDPEPDMLLAARQEAECAEVEIDIRQGSSFDLPTGIGPYDLAVMGRSFHWMDRAETLAILDGIIVPGGTVALLGEERPRTAENRWHRVLDEVSLRYGADLSAHRAERRDPAYRSHHAILLDSRFCDLETLGTVIRRDLSADDIVGLAFSRSVTALQKLGERAAAFDADLRKELAALAPDGRYQEIAEVSALVARRPSPAA